MLPTEPPTNKDFPFSLQCQVSTSAILETHFISSATIVRQAPGLFAAIFRSRLNAQHGQISRYWDCRTYVSASCCDYVCP